MDAASIVAIAAGGAGAGALARGLLRLRKATPAAAPAPAAPITTIAPPEKLHIAISNAERAAVAHWINWHSWRGSREQLAAYLELHDALRLAEIRPLRGQDGALLGLHLPVPSTDPPAPPPGGRDPSGAYERALRKHDLAEQQRQTDWLVADASVPLSRGAMKLLLDGIASYAIPANHGPDMVRLLEKLRAAMEAGHA